MNRNSIFFTFLIISCTNYSPNISSKSIKLLFESEKVGNQLFSQITDVKCIDDYYIIANSDQAEIQIINHSMGLVQRIGKYGEGPGELMDIRRFQTVDGLVIVDNLRNKFECYSLDGEHLQSIHVPNPNLSASDFSFDGSFIFYNTNCDEKPIGAYNIKTNQYLCFGEKHKTYSKNNWSMLIEANGEYIVSIGISRPVIQLYGYDFELKQEKDFSNNIILKELISFYEKLQVANPQASVVLSFNAQLVNNMLYVLINTNGEEKEFRRNTILGYQIEHDEISLIETISLPSNVYQTFDIKNDQLIAINYSESKFEKFRIL